MVVRKARTQPQVLHQFKQIVSDSSVVPWRNAMPSTWIPLFLLTSLAGSCSHCQRSRAWCVSFQRSLKVVTVFCSGWLAPQRGGDPAFQCRSGWFIFCFIGSELLEGRECLLFISVLLSVCDIVIMNSQGFEWRKRHILALSKEMKSDMARMSHTHDKI